MYIGIPDGNIVTYSKLQFNQRNYTARHFQYDVNVLMQQRKKSLPNIEIKYITTDDILITENGRKHVKFKSYYGGTYQS